MEQRAYNTLQEEKKDDHVDTIIIMSNTLDIFVETIEASPDVLLFTNKSKKPNKQKVNFEKVSWFYHGL